MWSGFDPQIRRDLAEVRRLFTLSRQTPTHEWPLVVVEEHDQLLVVRAWPDGTITAMTVPVAPSAGD